MLDASSRTEITRPRPKRAQNCVSTPPGRPERPRLSAAGEPRSIATPRGVRARVHRTNKRARSEEHTSELQSLMRISYAGLCLKKNKKQTTEPKHQHQHNNENNAKNIRK